MDTLPHARKDKLLLSARQLGFALFIGVLVVYPYLFLLNIFFPNELSFGKNTYIFGITVIIALCFLLQGKKILSKLGVGTVYFIIFSALLIMATRYWLYGEGLDKLFFYRIFLTPLLYCGVAYYYLKQKKERAIVRKIIFCNCFIMAVIGIVHTYIFPNVLLDTPNGSFKVVAPEMGGQREAGLLINPSPYANFILLGGFLLINSYKRWKLPRFFTHILMFLLLWGGVISASRWPFIVAILLFVSYLKTLFFSKKTISILLIILFLLSFLPSVFIQMTQKVATHSLMGRIIKYRAAIDSLLDNFSSFLVGPFFGAADTSEAITSFSDNSYLLFVITFGVPFFCLFVFLFLHIIRKTISINKNYFILIYFFITLFVTNSILWDIWLFYFFATLYSLQWSSSVEDTPLVAPLVKNRYI